MMDNAVLSPSLKFSKGLIFSGTLESPATDAALVGAVVRTSVALETWRLGSTRNAATASRTATDAAASTTVRRFTSARTFSQKAILHSPTSTAPDPDPDEQPRPPT